MTAKASSSDLGFRVADLLRTEAPWDVVGERAVRYEVHLQGTEVELERGPITIEGYGLRLFRPHGEGIGTGFQASTDLSPEGLRTVLADAEATARHAEFPAKRVDLPTGGRAASDVLVVDPKLWADPPGAIRAYVDALLRPFEGRKGVAPTFGSVKATLSELTMANSAGLRVAYPSTSVEIELGVKAFGGPEGAPPGEYWVTQTGRRLEPEKAAASVDEWCRYASDVRRAVNPPTGEQAVIVPPDVLAGILPPVLGFRCSGVARLRKIAPEVGTPLASERVTIRDEGDYPWAPGSAPYDDEGTPRGKRALLERGKVANLLYDSLYASAFSTRSTGSGIRTSIGPTGSLRFPHRPAPGSSTLVLGSGDGGTTEELAETAGDGILITQLGWPIPDFISGAFGGEIRIGYRVRGGKIAEPVRGGTVGGIVFAPPKSPSMLFNTEAVGSRAELADRLVAPPVLVRTLTVGGSG
jgi:TldD protein